jgi:hypothetical protein
MAKQAWTSPRVNTCRSWHLFLFSKTYHRSDHQVVVYPERLEHTDTHKATEGSDDGRERDGRDVDNGQRGGPAIGGERRHVCQVSTPTASLLKVGVLDC